MSKFEYRKRRLRQKTKELSHRFPALVLIILFAGVLISGVFIIGNRLTANRTLIDTSGIVKNTQTGTLPSDASNLTAPGSEIQSPDSSSDTASSDAASGEVTDILRQAEAMATGYDYDGAISLLSQNEQYASLPEVQTAVASYEETKTTLVKADINQITHVFFHTLIMDSSKAFDGDRMQGGYNQMMTTKDEFVKIMQSMYDRGYVLVSLHDMAYEVTNADGSKQFTGGEIMLPPGKKAFVLSQDDVCYYEYMDGDGFASRMIVGEDGLPTCEMKMDDGSVAVGDYDLVPILEKFIREHPDFSYKGARGVIAFTGYNGILGYRTAASYSSSPTYEADKAEAAKVAQALRDAGWELASHSWGHRNMGTIPFSEFKVDTDKWQAEVESLIGPTDIILFPFGSDIGGWQPYADGNERFQYLKEKGFRYFCNVDSSQYWVQLGKDHLRQGRRNLDGYRMYYDMVDENTNRLGDLFDVNEVFDKSRPTPVPPMS